MARKTKEGALKTKKKIIDSAKNIFYEKGFRDTTIDDIAKAIGLSRGAVYWHFKSKEEIFISIYDEFMSRLDSIVGETIGKKDATIVSIYEYMQKTIYMLVSDYSYRTTLDLLLFRTELTQKLQVLKQRDDLWVEDILNTIVHIVDTQIKKGDLKINLTSKELAVSIISMHRGLAFVYTMNNKVLPQENSYKTIIDIFFKNLCKLEDS